MKTIFAALALLGLTTAFGLTDARAGFADRMSGRAGFDSNHSGGRGMRGHHMRHHPRAHHDRRPMMRKRPN